MQPTTAGLDDSVASLGLGSTRSSSSPHNAALLDASSSGRKGEPHRVCSVRDLRLEAARVRANSFTGGQPRSMREHSPNKRATVASPGDGGGNVGSSSAGDGGGSGGTRRGSSQPHRTPIAPECLGVEGRLLDWARLGPTLRIQRWYRRLCARRSVRALIATREAGLQTLYRATNAEIIQRCWRSFLLRREGQRLRGSREPPWRLG